MQLRIICSLEVYNWCKLDYSMGKYPRIAACLYSIPYSCKIEEPDTYNIMG